MNLLLLLPLVPALAADPVVRAQYLMGTVLEIAAYGPGASEAEGAAFAEVARWDRVLSLYKEESELSALNRVAAEGGEAGVSPSLAEALALALGAARESGGAFDPTILPALKEGPAARARVGHAAVALDARAGKVRFLKAGMGLDFGGIGKGLALDAAARVLRERGVRAARLNFGGQIYALGAPPGEPGWRLRLPGLAEELVLKDASASTSGDSEKPGHIVSPFTGRPVRAAASATAIAPTGTRADAWSTALFVLGPSGAGRFSGCAVFEGRAPARQGACAPYLQSKLAQRNRP